MLFDPAPAIDWHCRQSVRDLYHQYRRYGRGKVAVAGCTRPRCAPGTWPRRRSSPLLAVAGVLAPRRPRSAAALAAPYVVGLAVATARTRSRLDPQARPHVAPAFVAMHVGWGAGFWRGVVDAVVEHVRRPVRPRSR